MTQTPDFKQCVPGFQPIVDVAGNVIAGYEVLARQLDRDGTLRSIGDLFYADDHLPSRDLLALDRHIRTQAIQRLPELSQGFISLNISPNWIDRLTTWNTTPLLRMLEGEQVDPARVVLEITEQKGTIESLKQVVQRYRQEGYRVAIDDFGAGNSHMHRIMELEPDVLKLDMKLFKNAANGGQHYDLVHSVSQLAEKSGCQLICEGVETVQEFGFGLELGAAWMQGFLFSEAIDGFLAPDHYHASVHRLRTSFLAERIRRERAYQRYEHKVQQELERLKRLCHDGTADPLLSGSPHILKYYFCDRAGTQTSPNYEVEGQGTRLNPEPLGTNWCWRPHFYQLLARRHTAGDEFTASSQYRDVSTRQLCRSYVTRLSDNRYLLVDVRQPDFQDTD